MTSTPRSPLRSRPLLCVALASLAGLASGTRLPAQGAPASIPQPAPIAGYVYVEAYELRLEVVARVAALAPPLQPDDEALDEAARASLLDALRARFETATALRADGESVELELSDAGFIQLDEAKGPLPDDRERIPRSEAIAALAYSSGRAAPPHRIELDWSLFAFPAKGPTSESPANEVPVTIEWTTATGRTTQTAAFGAGRTTQAFDVPDLGPPPALLAVSDVRTDASVAPLLVGIGFAALGVLAVALGARRAPRRRPSLIASGALALLLGAGSLAQLAAARSAAAIGEVEARGIVEALLKNVYQAFAYRDEGLIFDTLAESADGPLLEELYLDIQRGLRVEEDGGPSVRMLEVSLIDCELLRAADGRLRAGVVWVSAGSVSHWGHTHHRRNQYRGELNVEPVDGRWKLVQVDILQEERT